MLPAGRVTAELSESIRAVLWSKFAFICAQAGMTAAVRLPIGEVRTVDAAWAGFRRLVAEVAAVAEADGSPIPAAAQEPGSCSGPERGAGQLLVAA